MMKKQKKVHSPFPRAVNNDRSLILIVIFCVSNFAFTFRPINSYDKLH